MSDKIGYARVSTPDQKLEPQLDELNRAGCVRIFTDQITGTRARRPGIDAALDHLRTGDTLVIVRLDRLGRSLMDLIATVEDLHERGVHFQSLAEGFDTSTSGGKLMFQIFGALAEYERNLIVERTNAGLAAARARGRVGGRPKGRPADQRRAIAEAYHQRGDRTVRELCALYSISKPTLYKYVAEFEQ